MMYERCGPICTYVAFPYVDRGSSSAPRPIMSTDRPNTLIVRMVNAPTVLRDGRDVQIRRTVSWRLDEPDDLVAADEVSQGCGGAVEGGAECEDLRVVAGRVDAVAE
jgi:hypothetical protein